MINRVCLLPCLLVCVLIVEATSAAPGQPVRRVPAEFEPQEALWLQWPGPFEQAYVPAYAEITKVVVQYQPLHILYDKNSIQNQARNAIGAVGGDPDHPNITWHHISNENAWMRDNGPVYVVQDGALRIQDWGFDAWGGYRFLSFLAAELQLEYLNGFDIEPAPGFELEESRSRTRSSGCVTVADLMARSFLQR